MSNTPSSPATNLPFVHTNEVPARGGAPVDQYLAQTDMTQATGFKASKSVIANDDGTKRTEYRIEKDSYYVTATLEADGNFRLNTTRGGVLGMAPPGDAENKMEAALAAGLRTPASGAAPAQMAKDVAAIVDQAIAAGHITRTAMASMSGVEEAAQSLPARGPRVGGTTR